MSILKKTDDRFTEQYTNVQSDFSLLTFIYNSQDNLNLQYQKNV